MPWEASVAPVATGGLCQPGGKEGGGEGRGPVLSQEQGAQHGGARRLLQ